MRTLTLSVFVVFLLALLGHGATTTSEQLEVECGIAQIQQLVAKNKPVDAVKFICKLLEDDAVVANPTFKRFVEGEFLDFVSYRFLVKDLVCGNLLEK